MENPSIKTTLLAPTFPSLKKSIPQSGLGTSPSMRSCAKGCVGYADPQERAEPSRRDREVSSPQAPLLRLCTKAGSLVWGQQQADLSFPEPQRVVSQRRGGKEGEEYVYFRPAPHPRHAQILLTDRSSHVSL